PSITYSLRGDLCLDVEARAAVSDLHSGTFGGSVQNVLRALVRALASLHDATGAVTVPGVAVGGVDRELSAYERATIRPSLEIAGLHGGYTGAGVQGVIPSHAAAKLEVLL